MLQSSAACIADLGRNNINLGRLLGLASRNESGRRLLMCSRAKGEPTMGLAQYAIVAVHDQWGVLHDGESTANMPPRNPHSKLRPLPLHLQCGKGTKSM
jgi:hypothetical protein